VYYVFSIKQIHEGTATAQRDESETAANGRPNRTKIVQKIACCQIENQTKLRVPDVNSVEDWDVGADRRSEKVSRHRRH